MTRASVARENATFDDGVRLPPRGWDFLLTLLFSGLVMVLGVVFAISALGFAVLNQECLAAAADCQDTLVRLGQVLCTYVPPIVGVVSIVWAFVAVLRRKIGFWIAALGAALMTAAFYGGNLLMASGLPPVS